MTFVGIVVLIAAISVIVAVIIIAVIIIAVIIIAFIIFAFIIVAAIIIAVIVVAVILWSPSMDQMLDAFQRDTLIISHRRTLEGFAALCN